METYFQTVTDRLTVFDFEILAFLRERDATKPFYAISRQSIQQEVQFSEANVKKIITRLVALCFIESVTGVKSHLYYLTHYGLQAIEKHLSPSKEE